jgi:hypothetical protein
MKFADYIGMLAESVEELTFEKILDAVKNGKKVFYKNRKFDVRLDPSVPKGFTICALYPEDVAPHEEAVGVPSKEVFSKNYNPTEFYISRKPIYESVEELTFEKLKKELKAGKKFHWSNKGYTIVLDKNGDVSIVWDLGGRKENSEGLDERKFKVYSKDIFEAGKKLTEAKEVPDLSTAKVSKIVSALKNPLPLLETRNKLNDAEKEKFDDFIMLSLNYFINGKLPKDCTELDKEILEAIGFKVSGKTKEGVETIYTKISK